MCGILGIISDRNINNEQRSLFPSALQKLKHRGPDHFASFEFGKSMIAHVRLSILDTSSGSNQPYLSYDGEYVLTYNGEIFNYKILRNELIQLGYSFKTNGDVEVLMTGLVHFGSSFVAKMEGFFSFVFYNKKTNFFIAARDRFGEKPFYYAIKEKTIYFSSELRPLIALTQLDTINQTSCQLYFSLNYIPSNFSIIEGIEKLRPGCIMQGTINDFLIEKYFDVSLVNSGKVNPETSLKVKSLLENAVEKRLVADVPVGTFLSGGIDSTIVTFIASKFNPGLSTFSLGFRSNKQFSEIENAEKTAKIFNTNHRSFILEEDDFLNNFETFLSSLDEPFADSSAFNLYMLSKYTSPHVKVILSGDGADELFAGYNKHRAMWNLRNLIFFNSSIKIFNPLFDLLPSGRSGYFKNKFRQLKKYSKSLNLTDGEVYWNLACISNENYVRNLLVSTSNFLVFESFKQQIMDKINSDFNSVLKADFDLVLDGDMLVKVDRMSMANGLEIRSPFLDHDLVGYVMKIPANQKLNNKKGKIILRNAYEENLPAHVLHGPKRGFELPLERWFQNELRSKIENDWLSKSILDSQSFLNPSIIRTTMKKAFGPDPGDSVNQLWAILVFVQWLKRNSK